MKPTQSLFLCTAATILATAMLAPSPSVAADIIAEWATVKAPPVPELKPVTLDGKTTALLILDMMKSNCSARPRCVATVPNIKKLHDAARAAGAMVFYTLVGDNPKPTEVVDPGIAPREGEWVPQRGPDKFLGSGLDERLKAKGIKTVIVCGTSAQGVVIGTGSGSAQRGYQSHRAGRLHVGGRSLHGTIRGLAYVQRRASHYHQPDNSHAQRHDQVLSAREDFTAQRSPPWLSEPTFTPGRPAWQMPKQLRRASRTLIGITSPASDGRRDRCWKTTPKLFNNGKSPLPI